MRVQETTERDRLRFAFNGKELPQSLLRKINQMYVGMDAPRYRVFGYWYVFRLPEKFRPVQGWNVLEVELLKRDGQALPAVVLRDVELEIKYLMGKKLPSGFDRCRSGTG